LLGGKPVARKKVCLIMAMFLMVFLYFGCAGKQDFIPAEQVASVTADGVVLLPAENEELIISLLDSYHSAKYKLSTNSGPSTHRLAITTSEGAVYSFYRINEDTVEVSYRLGDIRKKYFLISTELSELIKQIGDGHSTVTSP